jgi:hypothetical protein
MRVINLGFKIQIIAGTRKRAPNMFRNSRIARSAPISAWNFRGDKIQMMSPIVRVVAIIIIARPFDLRA